jgi:hypothetical protein
MVSSAPAELYRLIKGAARVASDFLSNALRHVQDIRDGRAPRSIPRAGELLHMWRGVSVFLTEPRARVIARAYPNVGAFIARLQIAPGAVENGRIFIEKTAADPEHYTLWGDPADLRACVQSVHSIEVSG